MKKVLASIAVIALVAILGVAFVFAYGSYKDLELKKEEAKLEDKKNKKVDNSKTSENENQSQINNQTNQASTEKIQQDNGAGEASNEKAKILEDAYDVNSDEAQILSDEIDKADTDGDGVVTTKEMTPALQQFAEEGKFQPAGGGPTPPEDIEEEGQPKYTAEDAKNMSDDEFLDAYKEGMSEDEAAAVDEAAEGSGDYVGFLRGQVEARANGQGGNY
ncbi:hypothetical protein ACWEYS_07150 [Staphylococcus xylosus]|uniref:hypothetical protein n=1 Tax=Staphylococcus TaxID=1279 RepID=UPI000D1B29BC|nr:MULTISPECIES: hypothetical protein [Staphylococcus]PTH25685.1 hypothetical protein BU605_08385 [Staphylococcus arlettae]PTH55351.1 hypothetical protein BU597_00330 [Staphylococcus arlettae]PTI51752.1 hypothetical protein BU106_10420 [Staphylococcus xylosus]PTI54562.1 hypothetical protein BU111_05370 [Staphylococcus xylosus]